MQHLREAFFHVSARLKEVETEILYASAPLSLMRLESERRALVQEKEILQEQIAASELVGWR